jgi:hypothetical protein
MKGLTATKPTTMQMICVAKNKEYALFLRKREVTNNKSKAQTATSPQVNMGIRSLA